MTKLTRRAKWLALAVVLAAVRAHAADPAAMEEAKKAFSAGVVLLQDPDGAKYEEALALFRRAYLLSASWKALGNIALCELKLERDGEALATYERFLSEGGKDIDAQERAQVQRDIAALRAATAHVRLREVPSGAVVSDERTDTSGKKIVNSYRVPKDATELALGVHPGAHTFTVTGDGFHETWTTILDAGARVRRTFGVNARQEPEPAVVPTPSPPPVVSPPASPAPTVAPDRGPTPAMKTAQPDRANAREDRTAGWITAGVGALGIAGGLTSFAIATGKKSTVDTNCRDDIERCNADGQAAISTIHTLNVVTVTSLAIGAVGIGVGSWLVLKPSPTTNASASTGPAIVGGTPGWTVGGTW